MLIRPFVYARVYLYVALCEVADTPFHIQVGELIKVFFLYFSELFCH